MWADFQRRHIQPISRIVTKLGRIGFAARGMTWFLVGFFGFYAAVTSAAAKDQREALTALKGPGGVFLVVLMAIGIFCYSVWRLFEGLYGLNVNPDSPKLAQLLHGYVIPFGSASFYLIFGISILVGLSHPSSHSNLDWISKMSGNAFGSLVLSFASFILFGVAVAWLFEVGKRRFENIWDKDSIDGDDWVLGNHRIISRTLFWLASLGTTGRACLFMLLSGLILRVAWGSGVKSIDFGQALAQLQGNTWGRVLLALVSLMMAIFGLYSLSLSRYKKFVFFGGKFRELNPLEGEVQDLEHAQTADL